MRAAPRRINPLKANPLTGLAPQGPFKSIQNTPQKNFKKINLNASLVVQKDHMGNDRIFRVFPKLYLPLGDQPKNVFRGYPQGPSMGWPMLNFVEIQPVVWTPNPNKQTDRQTDRPLLYCIYRFLDASHDFYKESFLRRELFPNQVVKYMGGILFLGDTTPSTLPGIGGVQIEIWLIFTFEHMKWITLSK